ncbi:MAG: copper-binding protein [Nitrosarchaeum sp.]|nr:MAG: copper-binding protein [Nitrosarchaeum sp.]
MRFLIVLLLIPLLITPAFAQTNSQTLPTEKGTLDVKLSYDKIIPGQETKLNIDFINPQTKKIQEHIDYTITVSKDGESVFGPIPLTHTSIGSVKIPVEFVDEGVYSVEFGIEGILFQPIPLEKVSFEVAVGESYAQPIEIPKDNNDNGCLIATAAFGSELAPQVQQLREIRDSKLLQTESGKLFMSSFNDFYYSFSPAISDYERENSIFKEAVKIAITPMLSTLSIMTLAEGDSESEVLGLGLSVIALNIGMYVGIPIFGILKIYQFKRK